MDLNVERAAELARLGNDFRLTRMAMHVSLDDASRTTRIRANFLRGLERGDFSLYSSTVIAAGHAKIYARFLRIDHRPYVAVLQAEEEEAIVPRAAHVAPAISRRRAFNLTPLGFLFALVVLSIYLFVQFETFARTADAPQIASAGPSTLIVPTSVPTRTVAVAEVALAAPTSTSERRPVAEAPTPILLPSPQPTLVVVPTPTPTRNPGIQIDAVTSDRAWVQIESDNKVVFSGTLNPGEHRSWAATQRLMLWTGNAAGVSVTYNGKSLGRLGAVGEVVKLTWTATS